MFSLVRFAENDICILCIYVYACQVFCCLDKRASVYRFYVNLENRIAEREGKRERESILGAVIEFDKIHFTPAFHVLRDFRSVVL